MLSLIRKILFSKWMLLAALGVAGWQGWTLLRPKPWAPDELQQAVADRVCWDAAEAIPPELPGVTKIAVVRLGGHDANGFVSEALAKCIQRKGRYEVLHETFVGNLMRELGIDTKPVTTLDEAVKAGKKMGVSGVVFGEVAEFTRDKVSSAIRLDLRLAKVDTGEAVFAESFAAREPPVAASVAGVSHAIRASSAIKRILIWLAAAAIMPLLLIPPIKHFLEQESNALNFALLAGLTLFDLALAFVLIGLVLFQWLPALLLVASAVGGGVYNYWLLSTIEKLRK